MKRRIALLAAACVAVMALGGCQKVNEAPTAPAVTQGEADGAKEEPAGKKAASNTILLFILTHIPFASLRHK